MSICPAHILSRRALSTALGPIALTICTPAANANERDWDRASSIARDALVVVAVGLPAVKGDWNGSLQAAGSIGATAGVTWALKETFPETRPDGSDRKSFPSGHTSVAFAAAASLAERQGWDVGIPAHLAAAFVGFARVKADKHHWYDAVVGAAIGEAAGLLITRKPRENIAVIPWGDTRGGGVSFAMRF